MFDIETIDDLIEAFGGPRLHAGTATIDTVSLACNDYLCPIVIGNKFVYFDQWHFTLWMGL